MWCGNFEIFQISPLCVNFVKWCGVETLKFFKVPLCVGNCNSMDFSKSIEGFPSCGGEIDFFRVKIPVLGILAPFGPKKIMLIMLIFSM